MVAKTDLAGRLYRRFRTEDADWLAPKPQLFSVRRNNASRMLCLYDNAGEHFLPGRDESHAPVTRHLAVSASVVFVVDPTHDRRVQNRIGGAASVLKRGGGGRSEHGQDIVLIEAANRIRKTRGISSNERLAVRVIIALTKADLWARELMSEAGIENPWQGDQHPGIAMPPLELLDRIHHGCLRVMRNAMPELVATAKAIDPEFRFVPLSALGTAPASTVTPSGRESASRSKIRPCDIQPAWPAAPLLLALAAAEPTLLPEYASTPSATPET